MKVFVVLSVLIASAAAAALTPPELEMLETFDYDALFANDEQRNIVFNCQLEKGPCGDYKKLAELSLRIMKSKCAECSATQKTKYDTVLKQMQDKYEPFYNEFMKKVAATTE